jgi:hypothetical protein
MNSLQEQAKREMDCLVHTLEQVAPKLNLEFKVTDRDDDQVSFDLDGIPFTLGWGEAPRGGRGAGRWVVLYTLCVWHTTMGSRTEPPETIDTILLDSQHIGECTRKALETVYKRRIDQCLEDVGYKMMLAEEKNLEQI